MRVFFVEGDSADPKDSCAISRIWAIGKIYGYHYLHNKRGKHLGSIDPRNGLKIKDAVVEAVIK